MPLDQLNILFSSGSLLNQWSHVPMCGVCCCWAEYPALNQHFQTHSGSILQVNVISSFQAHNMCGQLIIWKMITFILNHEEIKFIESGSGMETWAILNDLRSAGGAALSGVGDEIRPAS